MSAERALRHTTAMRILILASGLAILSLMATNSHAYTVIDPGERYTTSSGRHTSGECIAESGPSYTGTNDYSHVHSVSPLTACSAAGQLGDRTGFLNRLQR